MDPIPTRLSPSRAWIIWLGLALATFAGLLVLGRHLTFREDEWTFIAADPSGLASYLEPHNEHWSTVPLILYRGVLALVGLHSYLPYLAVLALLHVAATAGAFALLIRRLPGWAALLAVLPLLVLGSGFEDLLWAFQIGFVGSVAAGTWGLVVLETNQRRWTAVGGVALLIVGLASSGMGIFFVVAAAVRLFVDPTFRRRSVWMLVPAVVFTTWYLAFGRTGGGGGLASVGDVIPFAARGLTNAVARIGGFDLAGRTPLLGSIAAAAALLLVAAVFVRRAQRRQVAPLALGGVVAAVVMYVIIALTRADLSADFATRSRYVYVAAFLLIPAAGDLIGSWSPGRRLPRAGVVALVALALLSVGANVLDLRTGRAALTGDASSTRAYLTVLAENAGRSWPDPSLPLGWPDLDRLAGLLERYGSPLQDSLVPSDASRPGKAALERALIGLAHGSFSVTADGTPPAGHPQVPPVLASAGGVVTPTDRCLSFATSGEDGWITVSVPDGGQLAIEGPVDGATVSFGRARPPASSTARPVPTSPSDTWSIAVPDLGSGAPWQARLDLPGPVTVRLCDFAP